MVSKETEVSDKVQSPGPGSVDLMCKKNFSDKDNHQSNTPLVQREAELGDKQVVLGISEISV